MPRWLPIELVNMPDAVTVYLVLFFGYRIYIERFETTTLISCELICGLIENLVKWKKNSKG